MWLPSVGRYAEQWVGLLTMSGTEQITVQGQLGRELSEMVPQWHPQCQLWFHTGDFSHITQPKLPHIISPSALSDH